MEFFLRQVYPWLTDIASYSSLLPFVAGLFLLRKRILPQFRFLFLYVVLVVIAEAAGLITILAGTRNNIWTIHLFTLFEYLILTALYYQSFPSPVIRGALLLALAVFLGACIADAFLLEGINQMNSVAKIVGNTFLISMAILYFNKVANDLNITFLDRDPVFLFSCAILIYKAGATMSYALFNDALAASYDAARICIAIIVVLNIFFNTAQVFILKRATL